MGGAQSVVTIADDPVLTAEAAWLADAVRRGVAGARRLPRRAAAGPRRWAARLPAAAPDARAGSRCELTAAGVADPVLGAIPAGAHGVHWNEDGFEPPPGAVELVARGRRGSCAAFRHGRRGLGRAVPPRDRPGVAGRTGTPTGRPPLAEAGVGEAEARAADAPPPGRQPALAAAIFGGFAAYAGARSISSRSLAID